MLLPSNQDVMFFMPAPFNQKNVYLFLFLPLLFYIIV